MDRKRARMEGEVAEDITETLQVLADGITNIQDQNIYVRKNFFLSHLDLYKVIYASKKSLS